MAAVVAVRLPEAEQLKRLVGPVLAGTLDVDRRSDITDAWTASPAR